MRYKKQFKYLDTPLIQIRLIEKLFKDSYNNLINDHAIYKQPQTKDYILRIHTKR